jgi:hypothetical protein
LLVGIVSDLGGHEALSTAQLQLARRCSMIGTECERMEQKAVEGGAFDAVVYGTLTGHLTRALKALGLKRAPRDITPTLQSYLAAVRQPPDPEDDLDVP